MLSSIKKDYSHVWSNHFNQYCYYNNTDFKYFKDCQQHTKIL